MATFKILVQHRRSDGFYPVYIRLTHNRKVCYLKTDKMVNDKGIVKGTKEVKDTFVLTSLMPNINKWVDRLNRVDSSQWTIEEVRRFIEQGEEGVCFSDFAREYIDTLYDILEYHSVLTYGQALNNLETYAGSSKIMFNQLTTAFIENWIKSLSAKKAIKFTYPTYIKRLFNEGVKKYNDYDNDIIRIKNNPWVKIKIPRVDKAKKKAITMEECRKFFSLVSEKKSYQRTIDICKMVLCLAGVNVADLYNMKKKDYFDGILHYERKKTRGRREDNAYIEMRVPDILFPTIEKYLSSNPNDEYLFSFHSKMGEKSLDTFLSFYLKKICKELLGFEKGHYYTPYTFRHTWATIAQNDLGASYEEIGFALNHISTHKVTMGYVKPDFSRAWELNEKVVEKIFFTNDPSRRIQEYHAPVFEKVEETFELSADAYFMGEVVAHLDGKGYKNTDEIIEQLMTSINDTVPKNCTIQIKVKNITKDQTKYFERIRDIK